MCGSLVNFISLAMPNMNDDPAYVTINYISKPAVKKHNINDGFPAIDVCKANALLNYKYSF